MRNHAWTLMLALTGALATLAPLPAFAADDPLPAPSLANDCGRTAKVTLKILTGMHSPLQFPKKDLRIPLGAGLFGTMPVHEDVALHFTLVVDKDGKPGEVITEGYAPQPFLDVYLTSVKTQFRYELPPPECRDRGVQLDWYSFAVPADAPFVIFPDDTRYPHDILDKHKLVSGAVRIRYKNDVELAVVAASTGLPALDGTMVKIVSDTVRASLKDRVMPMALEKIHFVSFVPDFIPTRLLMPQAPPPGKPPAPAAALPAPSLQNNCGRSARIDLKAIPGTHLAPFMPQKTVVVRLGGGTEARYSLHDEGATRIKVLVDKDGKPADVSVEESGASESLNAAVVGAIRSRYRWEAPPPECARDGVVVHIDYVATEASPDLMIYRDDSRFPVTAHDRKMGGAGIAVVHYEAPDRILWSHLAASTGSGVLDDAMLKAVEGAALKRLKADPPSGVLTTMFHVMFMPDFMVSPSRAATDPAIRVADRGQPSTSLLAPLDARQAVSAANDCGRSHIAYLSPISSSHRPPPYPMDAQQKGQEGAVFMRVLVDKDGLAQEATVVSSSGHAVLDDSIVNVIKGNWRWEKPPPECATRGAIVPVRFQYLYISGHPERIFLDDPDYPGVVVPNQTGNEGRVSYTLEKGKITDVAVAYSSGSEEVDAAMMMWATHQVFRADYSGKTSRSLEFVPAASPYDIDVLMGPPAPRPDH